MNGQRDSQGKGEEEKARQIALLIRRLWQRASPLEARSPVPRVMAHTAY